MIDIDTLQEIHTWQYLLTVNPVSVNGCCYAQSLLRLCPQFTPNFSLEISQFDQEDRQALKQFLVEHQLLYSIEPFLRPCDD